MEPLTLDKAKKIVANQTAMNFHNEAILTIARYNKNNRAIKAIEAVIALQGYYGHQPLYLTQIRNDVLNSMDYAEFKGVL